MKWIELTQGKRARVDDADFERLNQWKWYARKGSKNGIFYAVRTSIKAEGLPLKRKILMHNEILGRPPEGFLWDHWDGDGCNNQRGNLRAATRAQNGQNRTIAVSNRSGFKGVSVFIDRYVSKTGAESVRTYFRPSLLLNGCVIRLGLFKSAEAAARAYDKAALRYFGEFAKLNFPIRGSKNRFSAIASRSKRAKIQTCIA